MGLVRYARCSFISFCDDEEDDNNNNNNNKQEENRSRLPTSRSNFHSKDFMQEPSSVNYLKESLY